jgi:hypothetical protein
MLTRRDLLLSATCAPAAAAPNRPILTGSFFDLIHVNSWDATYWTDTCRYWKEENWRALMRDMHAVGMDTAILVSAAWWGRPLFPGYEKTVGIPVRMGCTDPLGACADEANRLGMKMFFGAGLRGRVSQVRDYADMQPPWPEVWFRWNTALAEALVDRYGKMPCFGGLYIPYEIDFKSYQIELYEKLIGKYLRPAVGKVKLLASPGSLGRDTNLGTLPADVVRMGIDILAPQDYGGRSTDPAKALELVKRNADGLQRLRAPLRDAGITLWTNCEVFVLEKTPSGRNLTLPGPVERVIEQIRLQAPLVEKLICYQYQGLMNRRTRLVNIGHPSVDEFYRGYRSFLVKSKVTPL